MSIIKLRSIDKTVNITPETFGKKIAKAMKDLSSSHVFFIVQQAYGEMDYSDVEKIFDEVLKTKQP